MNTQELHAAAEKLVKAAELRATWAKEACNPLARSFYLQVEQQFRDRADQTRSWARTFGHYERRGQAVPVETVEQIENAVCEFLRMVGRGVDDA